MAIVQCQNGHNYDNSKNAQCPYCTGSATIGITVPLGSGYDSAAANPIVNAPAPEFPKTAPVYGNQIEDNSNNIPVTAPYENKTVGIFVNEQGISNVCGWLVCIEGKKRGKTSEYTVNEILLAEQRVMIFALILMIKFPQPQTQSSVMITKKTYFIFNLVKIKRIMSVLMENYYWYQHKSITMTL
jgi:hypothetical protein